MNYFIYIKLTNGCNLKCKHCYNEIMKNHKPMSYEILDKVIQWIKNFRLEHPTDTMNMSLHGGEPMLYDKDKILYLISSLKDCDLKWCITTNLVYDITEQDLKIFNQMIPYNEKLILTSYDFGDTRFNKDTENKWLNNVHYIQSLGIKVQPIICVTDYAVNNITPEIFFKFIEENNFEIFNLERITNTGRAVINNIRPKNNIMNQWLLEIYKEYKKKNLICPLFDGVESSIQGIFNGCRARHCMERVITINPDGSLSSCPNMANKSFGNVDYIDNDKKLELVKFEQMVNTNCLLCEYYQYCNGDCCQLEFDDTGCPGPKLIYEYILSKTIK